jgi:hypothetical protein
LWQNMRHCAKEFPKNEIEKTNHKKTNLNVNQHLVKQCENWL